MTETEIKELFLQAIEARGIYAKIGYSRSVVYNWKSGRSAEPAVGIMLDVLYKLDLITISKNDNR